MWRARAVPRALRLTPAMYIQYITIVVEMQPLTENIPKLVGRTQLPD